MLKNVSRRAAVIALAAGLALAAAGVAGGEERKPAYADKFTLEKLRAFAFQALESSYPDIALKLENGQLVFPDGTAILFDDGETKSTQELLDRPSVFDMFFYRYPGPGYLKPAPGGNAVGAVLALPAGVPYPEDAGRVRNEEFFKALYGGAEKVVKGRLAKVRWLPSTKGPSLWFTTVNGADKALQAVSDELDALPELRPYLLDPGGTFNWRFIAGTRRLSVHAFGAAVDINVKLSDYWRNHAREETEAVAWRNRIPAKIVEVFERHGFIWGGWWYHFDTMHFEYRPELIAYRDMVEKEMGLSGASR